MSLSDWFYRILSLTLLLLLLALLLPLAVRQHSFIIIEQMPFKIPGYIFVFFIMNALLFWYMIYAHKKLCLFSVNFWFFHTTSINSINSIDFLVLIIHTFIFYYEHLTVFFSLATLAQKFSQVVDKSRLHRLCQSVSQSVSQ